MTNDRNATGDTQNECSWCQRTARRRDGGMQSVRGKDVRRLRLHVRSLRSRGMRELRA